MTGPPAAPGAPAVCVRTLAELADRFALPPARVLIMLRAIERDGYLKLSELTAGTYLIEITDALVATAVLGGEEGKK